MVYKLKPIALALALIASTPAWFAGYAPSWAAFPSSSRYSGVITPPTSNCLTSTGGTITVVGGNRIHTFFGSGTFTASGSCTVNYLVVGGGAGGGSGGLAGGGGCGQVMQGSVAVTAQAYTITVAGGGAPSTPHGNSGGSSSFDSIASAAGGGGGGADIAGGTGNVGACGGGGGAASGNTSGGPGTVGGSGGSGTAGTQGGGGGGMGSSGSGSEGGAGVASAISGTTVVYACGGAGAPSGVVQCSSGGGPNNNAAANSGSGGGGNGGSGGSGIVIISYPNLAPPVVNAKTCTGFYPLATGQTVCTFTASNSPTSWSVVSQSCAGCYQINNTGIVSGGPNAANVTSGLSSTITVTASNAAGPGPQQTNTINAPSTCAQGTAFPDGCPGAPVASIQFPTALSGGGYSGQVWITRPNWNVAGVDYPVGVPSNITLIDWQAIVGAGGTGPNTLTTNSATTSGNVLNFASTSGVFIGMPVSGTNIPGATTITALTPTSITLNNNVTGGGVANGATITINSGGSAVSVSGVNVNINSNNVVVDSVDFSLHGGAQAIVHGSGVTIKNSNFFYGTGCTTTCTYLINFLGGASNGSVLSSTLDGNGITLGTATAQASLMSFNGGGSFTAKYNLFKNQLQHTLEYNTGSAIVYQYNVFYNVTCNGSCGTPHMNFLQWGNQDQGTALVSYNFVYQPNDAGVGGQGIQFTPGAILAAMSFVFANNTQIYSPSGAGITDAHGNVGNQTGLIYNNYIDSRGNAFFFPDSTACPLDGSLNTYGAACASGNPSNINPVSGGGPITTTP